jgi:6-phospho-beta-glucosidase
LKITIIGGGSTYTPELINGFLAKTDRIPITELWLMDIDRQRLEIVGGFAKRMVAAKKAPIKIVLTDNQQQALEGVSYVITQLRVGQMPARRADEYLGQRHGLIGQETTGVGGMAKALRTVPVILDIAHTIQKVASGALLINFTNPSGLVTEALKRYAPEVTSVGLCNAPLTTKMVILEQLEAAQGEKIDPGRAELKAFGLNHLSWNHGFTLDGEDIWPWVMEKYIENNRIEKEWDENLLRSLNMIPNYYLAYFYNKQHKLAEQKKWPPSRAEEVIELEKVLLKQYSDPMLTELPPELMERGGAYYSTLATHLIDSHYNDIGDTHIVNVRHENAVPGVPSDWVMELPCRVDKQGFHPIPTEPLPYVCNGLVAQIKSYELLTIEAAVHGDRKSAYQALLTHPLGPQAEEVNTVLTDMLEINRPYLPQFWK